jgi:hypothetical protein
MSGRDAFERTDLAKYLRKVERENDEKRRVLAEELDRVFGPEWRMANGYAETEQRAADAEAEGANRRQINLARREEAA